MGSAKADIPDTGTLKPIRKGINSVDSQLVSCRCGLRPRAAIFMKRVQGIMVPGFTTRVLVTAQIKCGEVKDHKDVIV